MHAKRTADVASGNRKRQKRDVSIDAVKGYSYKRKSYSYSWKTIKKPINQLTRKNFFSIKSWFISECGTNWQNDESCWLIFDEYLFILLRFALDINGDFVGLWGKNDDDAVGVLIVVDIGDNSTNADLLVIEELQFSSNSVFVLAFAVWWILDDDKGVSRLTKFIN